MNKKKKVVFLYAELAGYVITCLEYLSRNNDHLEIYVFHFPVNAIAPFNFHDTFVNSRVKYICVANTSEGDLPSDVGNLSPDLIICSGWISKNYIRVCKKFHDKCTTVLAFDTQNLNTARNKIGRMYLKIKVKSFFKFAFVPGSSQAEFAKSIGFNENEILKGFYCCDLDLFSKSYIFDKRIDKKFVYVGRFVPEKGVHLLSRAFKELQDDGKILDWELVLIGKGNLNQYVSKNIIVHEFMQPKVLSEFMKSKSVFVLPSTYEPWGVVLQEFTAAGFPVICSDKVGSSEVFLEENKNGFYFEAGNLASLKNAMLKFSLLSSDQMKQMGNLSHVLSKKINLEQWSESINILLKN